jgi:hypothetical protein
MRQKHHTTKKNCSVRVAVAIVEDKRVFFRLVLGVCPHPHPKMVDDVDKPCHKSWVVVCGR